MDNKPDTNFTNLHRLITAVILVLFVSISNVYSFTNRPSKPPVGARIDPLHPMSRDLAAWWLFNDGSGSSLTDITGKYHGTLTNMDANDWVGSPRGGALAFDKVNDYVGTGTGIDLVTSFTITAWFLRDATGGYYIIAGKSGAGSQQFYIRGTGDNKLSYYDPTNGEKISPYVVPISVWTFGAMVVNGTSLKIYANSDEVLDVTIVTPPNYSSIFSIGAAGTSANDLFQGLIDDVRVYNRALSADEVAELYRNPYVGLIKSNPVKWYGVDDPAASFTPTVTWW